MTKTILLLILLFSTSVFAQVETDFVATTKHSIDSKSLKSKRDYWVRLPIEYDSTQSYPVIYVLDAEWRFSITSALEKELSSNGKIPRHIVVGIPCPNRRFNLSFSRSKVNCSNTKDTIAFESSNSGNGSKFLSFIENELIKEIRQKYSTNGFNILIGHSLGGYFCSYILPFQKSFNSLQIYDPSIWYSEGEAIIKIDSNLSQKTRCHIFISSSSKSKNNCSYHYEKIEELKQTLNRYPNIHSNNKYYENESHNSMYLHSFLDGITVLYDGYELKPEVTGSSLNKSIIEKHYKRFSKSIQFNFPPPYEAYLEIGKIHFHQKEYKQCIEALKTYLEKKPVNDYALELIGDAYISIGKVKEGLDSYLKAQELSHENVRLKKKIEGLK